MSDGKTSIFVRFMYDIEGKFTSLGDPRPLNFTVPVDNLACQVTIGESNVLTVVLEIRISDSFLDQLRGGETDGNKLTPEALVEHKRIRELLHSAAQRIVHVFKFYLRNYELSEEPMRRKREWSEDAHNWRQYPSLLSQPGVMALHVGQPYGPDTPVDIQLLLTKQAELLPFSMRFLHRAKRRENSDTVKQWIDATVAAELAIKEFLIRKAPQIETLLLEMPSPPLSKMYGSILKSFTGQESPKRKELIKGAEIRNTLIHRPEDNRPDWRKTSTYVLDVEIAIYHLLTLLYPQDRVIVQSYINLSASADSIHTIMLQQKTKVSKSRAK